MLVVSRTILSSIINCITQCFFLMIRRPPSSIPSDTLYPCTTLVRSRSVYSHSAARRLPSSPAGSASLARHWPDVRERRSAHCRYATLPHLSRTPKRSEEHTSELQSLMRISYAVFCLKKKNINLSTQPTSVTKNNNQQSIRP